MEFPARYKKLESKFKIDAKCQKKAYALLRNYKETDNFCQVLFGEQSTLDYADDLDLEHKLSPYMCIMALALCQDLPPSKWHAKALDFVLKSGAEIYKQYEETYDKIDEYHIKFIQNEYVVRLETIFDTFFGKDMFDSFHGHKTLQSYFENEVFAFGNYGLFVSPNYVAAVVYYKNLFYLFEPYPCKNDGVNSGSDEDGYACIQRFLTLENMVFR